MRLLFIGDVFARPGREALTATLPALRRQRGIDLVVANGENIAGGAGLTQATARELFSAGVDVVTSGNHIWNQREALSYLERERRVLRPYNLPPGSPGSGSLALQVAGVRVLVVNLMGRLFMRAIDDPFRAADAALEEAAGTPTVVIVDFHAEATSEKRAMGFYLDGRAALVAGTHTHVPTADAQILPKGTAYVTDAGMCGARHSVIGMSVEPIVAGFLTALPNRAAPAEEGPIDVNAVLVEIDAASGRATAIARLDYHVG